MMEQIRFTVENKTADGLRFRLVQATTGNRYIEFNEEDVARIMTEFGSSDPDAVLPLLRRIGKLGIKEKIWDPDIIKFAIAFIRGIRPRDLVSALLGLQMMIVHETIAVNHGRINQARVMEDDQEEEDAQRAVNRLMRALIRLVEAFDRHQNGGEQKFAVPNGHRLAKTSKRPEPNADPTAGIFARGDRARVHQTSISDTREGDPTRSESYGVTLEIKTSDDLTIQACETSYNAYLNVDEQDAVRVMAKYGSSDPDFVIPLIRQIAKSGIKGISVVPDIITLALSFVRSIGPRDEIGALLGYHMAVANEAISFNFGRLNEAQFRQYSVQEGNADRAVNWSARTFIALEEAFQRHQNGREQKLMVRHITAANGHGLATTKKRPKRGIANVNTPMNGTACEMERHSDVLPSENQDGE
jgi:hypothetical protein